jgi:hypothetical protein
VKSGGKLRVLSTLAGAAALAVIVVLLKNPAELFRGGDPGPRRQSRVVIPQRGFDGSGDGLSGDEILLREETLNARVAMNEGEIIAAILTQDLDGDKQDEQIIAYTTAPGGGAETPIRIAYISFDPALGGFRRRWSVSTGATRPGTVSLHVQDVLGDRSNCIIVTGMNGAGQHTLTILRRDGGGEDEPWRKIADIGMDGTITIREAERGQAYRMGQSAGQSFTIAAYGRDPNSENILDQIEIIYRYHEGRGRFEQAQFSRIPGPQVQQRRVRELLSGGAENFEGFIDGIWYHVSPQGTVDLRQYIYFDSLNREIIFCNDETQQVFNWRNSSATRYGLYVSCQNFSVSTLRRSIDIELESLSSLRIKVVEDVRLNISVNNSWDGSYRRTETVEQGEEAAAPEPYLEAVYDGSIGRLRFNAGGGYELDTGNEIRRGSYTFYAVGGQTVLELRPGAVSGNRREIWLAGQPGPDSLSLRRVILSTRGFQPVHEPDVNLTRAE